MPDDNHMDKMDASFRATLGTTPKWSMREKPDFLIGAPVPSWQKSIPGPQYNPKLYANKDQPPSYSIRPKPEMVIGMPSPKWRQSVPAPSTYDPNIECNRPTPPKYSIYARREMPGSPGLGRPNSAPELDAKDSKASTEYSTEGMDSAYGQTKQRAPKWSLASRGIIVGSEELCRTNAYGPKYDSVETTKTRFRRAPNHIIGAKLPSEAALKAKDKTPAPSHYGGTAMHSKQQCEIDSTRTRGFTCSFGVGSRWEGVDYNIVKQGGRARYDSPVYIRKH